VESIDDLLADVARRASAYVTGLANRSVAPQPDDIALLQSLAGSLPETPSSASIDVVVDFDCKSITRTAIRGIAQVLAEDEIVASVS
jgi:hypothetical protein